MKQNSFAWWLNVIDNDSHLGSTIPEHQHISQAFLFAVEIHRLP
jgi:hypothetical protein